MRIYAFTPSSGLRRGHLEWACLRANFQMLVPRLERANVQFRPHISFHIASITARKWAVTPLSRPLCRILQNTEPLSQDDHLVMIIG